MHGKQNLIWIDIETTGIEEESKILELTCVVTDTNLNILDHVSYVINHPISILNEMNEWCRINHTQSGLVNDVLNSNFSLAEVEKKLILFLKEYSDPKKSPLCGNNVANFDRKYIKKYMPALESYFHYRNIDVSTISILYSIWGNGVKFHKEYNHRSLSDIKESINELKYYRENFFRKVNCAI